MMTTLINGVKSGVLDATDRGLMYGDGLFETLRIAHGKARHWRAHMARLSSGCTRLGISGLDESALEAEANELIAAVESGVLKIVITRGSGDRGYRPPANCLPTRILQLHSAPDYPASFAAEGVSARICSTRLGRNAVLAGMKHLNRLEQVLARAEWRDPAVAEGLMLDTFGLVVSGTMSNLFFVLEGTLCTPDLAECGVAGVTRLRILEWAGAQNIPTRVARYTLEDFQASSEAFFCNSLIGVWPVRRCEDMSWPLGELTQRVATALQSGETIR